MAENNRAAKGIKAMPEDTRPKEKLFSLGGNKLKDEELLSILLGSGSQGESALELAERILKGLGGKTHMLKNSNFSSLCQFKGMGMAKASTVLAAVELARRLNACPKPEFKTVYLGIKPGDDPDLFFKGN